MNRNKQVVTVQITNAIFNKPLEQCQEMLFEVSRIHYQIKGDASFCYKGQRYFARNTRELPQPLCDEAIEKMEEYLQERDALSKDLALAQGYFTAACNAVQEVGQLYHILPDTVHHYLKRMNIQEASADGIVYEVMQWSEDGLKTVVKRMLEDTLEG